MSRPLPNTKHTFLPLVAEPHHPHYDKTSPPPSAKRCSCTSITSTTTEASASSSSAQEPQAWEQQTPHNPSITVVPQGEEDQSPPLEPKAAEATHASESTDAWERLLACPWSVPHALEHQKHAWYGQMLGMGAAKVKDDWGFSSASVSRSHSPKPGHVH